MGVITSSKIIPELYKDKQISAVCALEENLPTRKRMDSIVKNGLAGGTLALLLNTTGPMTALHEAVGHGLLGFDMTSHALRGKSPRIEISGWESFKAIGKAKSISQEITAFFKWITGYEAYKNGIAGRIYLPPSEPNALGRTMGPAGQSAWISVAGSLPGLAVNSLSAATGMQIRKQSPALGNTLVALGLAGGILDSFYPISAAALSANEIELYASGGHDFANFALQMGKIFRVSPHAAAIATALIWTSVVPAAALFAYLSAQSDIGEVVPDAMALRRWLQKAQSDPQISQELATYAESFSHKDQLLQISQKIAQNAPLSQEERTLAFVLAFSFIEHLLDCMPTRALEKEKREILDEWKQGVKPDRIEKTLTIATITGSALTISTKALQIASIAAPSLATAATALTYTSPLFVGASLLSSAYQVHKDFSAPDTVIPKAAKMLSVAALIVNIATTALILVSLFLPGFNLLFLTILIAGSIANIALNYARSQSIKKQFQLAQALQPETWSVMHPLWLKHQQKSPGTPMPRPLQLWHNRVKHLLDPCIA